MERVAAATLVAGLVLTAGADAGAARPAIRWHACGADFPQRVQCGALSVPMDYARPAGPRITLGFARLRARDRAHRVGSLIVNPGGPGGPGSQVVALEAAGRHLWHPALHERFDLIGMDPRGIGMSTPIRCDPATFNQPVSFFPRDPGAFEQLRSYAAAMGDSCLRLTGPLLRHVDTLSVARDLEALRRALGDGKLNFLGLSYGAEIGTLYAERYPRRIRAMALDGILDHSISTERVFSEAAAAYEDTFNRFAAWCRRASGCAWHGHDVGARFDRLVRRADRQPIAAPRCAAEPCRPTVTGAEIRLNAFNLLVTKQPIAAVGLPGWGGFGAALADAERGDAGAFASHLATAPGDDPFPGLAVDCVDYPRTITTARDFAAMTRTGRAIAPHTQGASEAWLGVVGCMGWPVPVANPPHAPRIRAAPPILLVSARHDPSTSYVWARRTHRQIPGTVLLTRAGDGHTSSWLGPRSSTNAAIARYLITRRMPAAGSVYPD